MSDFTFYHGGCYDSLLLPREPGDIVIFFRRDMVLHPSIGCTEYVTAGSVLVSYPSAECVHTRLTTLFDGSVEHCADRRLLAILLGVKFRPDGSCAPEGELFIDAWLREETNVGVRYNGRTSGAPPACQGTDSPSEAVPCPF